MPIDIVCPICRGPLTKTASVEKPLLTEVRGRCEVCKAHVVALVTAEQFESQAETWNCDSCAGNFTYDQSKAHSREFQDHLMTKSPRG